MADLKSETKRAEQVEQYEDIEVVKICNLIDNFVNDFKSIEKKVKKVKKLKKKVKKQQKKKDKFQRKIDPDKIGREIANLAMAGYKRNLHKILAKLQKLSTKKEKLTKREEKEVRKIVKNIVPLIDVGNKLGLLGKHLYNEVQTLLRIFRAEEILDEELKRVQ